MEKSSKNNFEQQWEQKFEKASLIPPADMWDRIEADLDEESEKKPFILLWGVPAYVISGIAATLILVIGGWFLLSESETNTATETAVKAKNEQIIQERPGDKVAGVEVKDEVNENDVAIKPEPYKSLTKDDNVEHTGVMSNTKPFKSVNSSGGTLAEVWNTESRTVMTASATDLVEAVEGSEVATVQKRLISALYKLTGQPYEEYPVRYILKRNKLAYVEPVEEELEPDEWKQKSWVGLISGLSPFKPNFQSGSLNQLAAANVDAYSSNDANFTVQRSPQDSQGGSLGPMTPGTENSSFTIPTVSPIQQFTNGRAFNLGIQAGKQLTQRLSLESGVRYIQGNSPFNTNVYTLNEQTGEVNAFAQDYLTQNKSLSNAVVAPQETLNNSYEYLSVPVQLAYGIPLFTKLNIEVMGGVSADMFLQNTLQSETTDVASLSASNSVFRTLGMSGLGGVRLNYLVDDRWELTVGSAFQQALVSNFESGTSAKLRPQMLGVNYGVNYHF